MNRDQIAAALTTTGATYKSVAKSLGVDIVLVREVAAERGLERPRGVPLGYRRAGKIDEEVLRSLYQTHDDVQLAARFGCSKQAVHQARGRLGLKRTRIKEVMN